MNTRHTDGHIIQSEPMSNKATNRLAGNAQTGRCSCAGFKVARMWRWSSCLILQRERIHEKSQQRTEKWKEANRIQGPYSEPLDQVLLKLPLYMSWLTPFYSVNHFEAGFAILNNQKSHQMSKFSFWPLLWTSDMSEYYPSSNLVSWLYRKIITEMLWFHYTIY